MQQNDSIFVKSYKRVWKIEKFFYSFEKWKLPRPITFLQVWYFLVAFVVVLILNNHFPILFVLFPSTLVKFALIPGAISFYLSKVKYDGKNPHKWIYGQLVFYSKPKLMSRYKPTDLPGKMKYSGIVSFRERYEVLEKEKTSRVKAV